MLLLGVDRVAAAVAGQSVAEELQRAGGLTSRPEVTIGGFPFLVQAVGGRYDRIDVRAVDVPAGGVSLRTLDVRLTGARVPLSAALSGAVTAVPVDRVEATVLLGYAELARRSGERRLTVAPAGDRVRVRGSVRVLGRELAASATSRLTVDGDRVVMTAESFRVGNAAADALLTRVLRDRFDFRFRVGPLPYGLQLDGVRVQPDGIAVGAVAAGTVLETR